MILALLLQLAGISIRDEGVHVCRAQYVDFVGEAVEATCPAGVATITIDQPWYFVVEEEGSSLTQRPQLNFVGGIVTASDGIGETRVTLPDYSASASTPATANTAGVATTVSRGDHAHGPPSFSDVTGTATDAQIPNNITITLAATATALAGNGANCAAGNYPLGVDASGAVEGCTAVGGGGTHAILSATHTDTDTGVAGDPAVGQMLYGKDQAPTSVWTTLSIPGAGRLLMSISGTNGEIPSWEQPSSLESSLEAVLDLQDQQGAVTDAQVPNTITIDFAAAAALASNFDHNPTDCAANEFAQAIASTGNLTCAAIADADVPNTITVDLAAAATALAANGTNCAAGNYARGVDASGNAENCTAVGGGSPHNLLDNSTHPDTVVASPAQGDLIVGTAGALWDVLPVGTDTHVLTLVSGSPAWSAPVVYAPANAEYIVSEANGSLSAEVAPSAANQVPVSSSSTAAAWGTVPDAALTNNYSGVGTCTNQFARVLNDNAAPTCATVSLTADVTGTLPVANGGSRMTLMRLAANSALSTTTFTNLTGFSMTLAASTSYSFICHFFTTANAATVGVQFEIDYSGTITAGQVNLQLPASTSAVNWMSDTTASFTFQPLVSQGNVAGTNILSGTIEANTTGTLQFQHASETATLTTVLRGSFCQVTQH